MLKTCIIEGCNNKILAKNLCKKHYYKLKEQNNTEKCIHEDCNKGQFSKGYCLKHYKQFYRHGKTFSTKYDDNKIIYHDDFAEIIINNNEYGTLKVLIDLDDIEECKKYKWYIQKVNDGDYFRVCTCPNGKTIKLHRFIMKVTDENYEIDHIDGNTLNNRKNNLRICLHIDNMKNQKLNKNNTSGYKGVWLDKNRNVWVAEIHVNNKKIILGYDTDKEKVIKLRQEAEEMYFGEFMRKGISDMNTDYNTWSTDDLIQWRLEYIIGAKPQTSDNDYLDKLIHEIIKERHEEEIRQELEV